MYNNSAPFFRSITGGSSNIFNRELINKLCESIPPNFAFLDLRSNESSAEYSYNNCLDKARPLISYSKTAGEGDEYYGMDTVIIFSKEHRIGYESDTHMSKHVTRSQIEGHSQIIIKNDEDVNLDNYFEVVKTFNSYKENGQSYPLGIVYKLKDNYQRWKGTPIKNIYLVTNSYYSVSDPEEYLKVFDIFIRGLKEISGAKLNYSYNSFLDSVKYYELELYLKSLVNNYKEKEADLTRRIEARKADINAYSREILPISYFLKDQEHFLSKIKEQLDLANNISGVKKAWVDSSGNFHLESEHIYIKQPYTEPRVISVIREDEDGREYNEEVEVGGENQYWDIGELKMLVKTDGNVYFTNKTRNVRAFVSSAAHPHATESNGFMCLGEIQSVVLDLLNTHEYTSLASLLINYARSVNITDTAGKHVVKWPTVSL